MSVLRSLLFVLVLGAVPLHAAEKEVAPAELKKQIEAANRENATLDAENAVLRKKISELEQKTRELAPQVMTAETTPAEAAAPAKPARKKVVPPPPAPPEESFLDSLLADPMMLGAAGGAIVLLLVLARKTLLKKSTSVTGQKLDAFLGDLQQKRLLFRHNGHYLALAVRAPGY